MRRSLVIVLVLIVLIAGAGCSGPVTPARAVHDFTIEVNNDWGLSFSGSYMVVMPDGSSKSQSVEGAGDVSYKASGSMVSCVFQKQTGDADRLAVTILRDGNVVSSSETTAAYGVVSLATP